MYARVTYGDVVLFIRGLDTRFANEIEFDKPAAAHIGRQVKLLLLRRPVVHFEHLAFVVVRVGRIADLDLYLRWRIQEIDVLHVGRVEHFDAELANHSAAF